MVRHAVKALTHILGNIAVVLVGLITVALLDKTAPDFTLAMWTIPHELRPGMMFTIKRIYVRNNLCSRHTDHGFSQDDIRPDLPSFGGHQMQSPPNLKWPSVAGLLIEGVDARAPLDLHKGDAVYVMSIKWRCWWNIVSWIYPYTQRLTYPVWIEEPEQ